MKVAVAFSFVVSRREMTYKHNLQQTQDENTMEAWEEESEGTLMSISFPEKPSEKCWKLFGEDE